MKREVINDICARLPYEIFVHYVFTDHKGKEWPNDMNLTYFASDEKSVVEYLEGDDTIKPYLRPMSSMTHEKSSIFFFACDEFGTFLVYAIDVNEAKQINH